MFYIADNLELFAMIMEAPRMFPKIILVGLPTIWIILSIIFAFIAGTSLHKTKKGYRFPVIWILVIIFALQIIGGLILSNTNFPAQIEHQIHQKMRMQDLEKRKELLWRAPEQGFLGGIIKEISDKENWILIDFKGEQWILKINDETKFPRNLEIQLEQKILVKGAILDPKEKTFDAQEIMPFRGLRRKMMFQKRTPRNGNIPPKRVPPNRMPPNNVQPF